MGARPALPGTDTLRIDKTLSIGNSMPAPVLDTMAMVTEITRLTYVGRCLLDAQYC